MDGDAAAVSRLLPAGGCRTELDLCGPAFQHPDPASKTTPLIVAAARGHTQIVRMILERAPNTKVDYADAVGFTALFVAAVYHHADILRLLADRCANVSVTSQRRTTPLRHAVEDFPHMLPPRDPDPDGARQLSTVRALLRLGAGTLPSPRPSPPCPRATLFNQNLPSGQIQHFPPKSRVARG